MNLIFDIGANRGLFTDKCLSMYNDIEIILIEANPELINFLESKYINNKKVKILNCLISNESDKMIDFYISKNYDVVSTASLGWINESRFTNNCKWDKVIKVKSKTIDDLIYEFGNPDLIKIDVEGYEYEVIQGLTKKQKDICFEWAEEKYDDANDCCNYLEKLGYENFGYIFSDNYMVKPNVFSRWSESSFHKMINKDRKLNWGMIWVN